MTTIITAGDRRGGPRDYPVGRRRRPEGKRSIAAVRLRNQRTSAYIGSGGGRTAAAKSSPGRPPSDVFSIFIFFIFFSSSCASSSASFPPYIPKHYGITGPKRPRMRWRCPYAAASARTAGRTERRGTATTDCPDFLIGKLENSPGADRGPDAGETHTCFFFFSPKSMLRAVRHSRTMDGRSTVAYRSISERRFRDRVIPEFSHASNNVVLKIRKTHGSRFVVFCRRLRRLYPRK